MKCIITVNFPLFYCCSISTHHAVQCVDKAGRPLDKRPDMSAPKSTSMIF